MQKIPVYSKEKSLLSFTTPAKARILIKKGKAVVLEYKPFKIKINKKGGKMFVAHNQEIVNLDKVQIIEQKGEKVMFFMDNVTARTNWKYESEEEAKKAYEELKSLISSKDF